MGILVFQGLAQIGFFCFYMDERVIWRFKNVSRLRANNFLSLIHLEIKGLYEDWNDFKPLANVIVRG